MIELCCGFVRTKLKRFVLRSNECVIYFLENHAGERANRPMDPGHKSSDVERRMINRRFLRTRVEFVYISFDTFHFNTSPSLKCIRSVDSFVHYDWWPTVSFCYLFVTEYAEEVSIPRQSRRETYWETSHHSEQFFDCNANVERLKRAQHRMKWEIISSRAWMYLPWPISRNYFSQSNVQLVAVVRPTKLCIGDDWKRTIIKLGSTLLISWSVLWDIF